MKIRKGFILLACVILAIQGITTGQAVASEPTAQVRVIHASPDAPQVDVYVDGKPVVRNAGYQQASDYLDLPAGKRKIEIYPSSAAGTGKPVIKEKIGIQEGKRYTLIAVGRLADIQLIATQDEMDVQRGKTKARFIHTSPDAPAVDIAVRGGEVIFPNVSFKEVSNYIELNPGTVDLEVRLAGKEDIVLEVPQVELRGNTIYSILAMGLVEGSPGLEAIIFEDERK